MRASSFYFSASVALLGLLFLRPATAQTPSAGDWAVGDAQARFELEVDAKGRQSPVTFAGMYLPNARWASMPIGVFDDTGQRVGSEILSYSPGDQLVIAFDSTTNAKHYNVYFGSQNLVPLPLKDDHGGFHLETRQGDGKELDTLKDMLDAWDKAADKVEGKAIALGLFEGGNRFGPQKNLLLHFQGWFKADANEHLDFAVDSTDSAFCLIDGKEVAEWPGGHDWGGGQRAEHSGGVDVTAGVHTIDYYNDYFHTENPPVMACLAAKGGPLQQWTMLTPDNPLFIPAARATVTDYAVSNNAAPPVAIDYVTKTQSLINDDVTDLGFITLTLTCRPPQDATVTWTFDDGTTATGQQVDHLFARPGVRNILVKVDDPNNPTRPVQQILHVHPDWYLMTTVRPDLSPDDTKEILSRDPNTFTASDLASCAAMFETYEENEALLKLAPAMAAKMGDAADGDLIYYTKAADLVGADLKNVTTTMALLQAIVTRCGSAPAPALVSAVNSARLTLAEFTLRTTDHAAEAKNLLAGVTPSALTGDDPRRYAILQGDVAVALGDVAAARKIYEQQSAGGQGIDARGSVRETGEVDQARAFINSGDYESAEDSLRAAASSSPIEKLSDQWALTRLRLYEAEYLPDVALIYAKRLLNVITDDERSELLFRLTDLATLKGDKALAEKSLAELMDKHPYSEEAAKAKAKWPSGV